MAETGRQKRITGRVMHEFKHGELKSGRGGKGGKVKSRRQAIAIALNEAGDSQYESARRNRRNLRRTERKESEGRTGQQAREGKSRLGAAGQRESTRAMGGKNAEKPTARGRKAGQYTRASRRRPHPRGALCPRSTPRHRRAVEDDQAPAEKRAQPSLRSEHRRWLLHRKTRTRRSRRSHRICRRPMSRPAFRSRDRIPCRHRTSLCRFRRAHRRKCRKSNRTLGKPAELSAQDARDRDRGFRLIPMQER